MKTPSFADLTSRAHLKNLEEGILMLSLELDDKYRANAMAMVYAMVEAAFAMAERGSTDVAMEKSFNHHIIEQCARNLGRIRNRLC